MVNNNLCARDKDGQFLGNKYDKSESLYGLEFLERNYMTLMMYNPNLCLQPGKLIRLGYLKIEYPGIKGEGSGLSRTWGNILKIVRTLQGEVVDKLRMWNSEGKHDHLCRYFLDDDSPLLQPFDVSRPEIGIQLARIVVELGHFFNVFKKDTKDHQEWFNKLSGEYNNLTGKDGLLETVIINNRDFF